MKGVPHWLNRPAHTVSAAEICQGALANASGLIIPGGADLPYCEKLNGEGNRQIHHFVEQGGFYLGICAGAYYACQTVEFQGADYQVQGERELGFFEGIAKGSLPQLTGGHYYSENVQSKTMVKLDFVDFPPDPTACYYYHGGSTFLKSPQAVRSSQIFAYFADGSPAIVGGQFGKGRYLLSSVHFELDPQCYAELIVKNSPESDRLSEQEIHRALQQSQGKSVWQLVQNGLK
ncbi:BPL-N domain-containing protein [Haemophilus paracuniculus]|uniref:BPL-N domain-containing protein n=1 Tax=Haemophilus paracuniculus TaxID=734 RepID=UPI000992DE3B|nr:BPL-N domain-containing protein [Haemophilus paracuniculus]